MKKIFLTLVLCSFVVGMFAQDARLGVTAGLNVSNEVSKSGSISLETDWKAGFQVGVLLDYALTSNLSLVPEFLFSQRGGALKSELDSSLGGGKITQTETLNYLQLPINLAYKFDLGNEQKLFPFAGVYLGYAMSGTQKIKSGNISNSEDVKFGSKENESNAFDYGLNFGVGYQYSRIIFRLQYNLGIANMSNVNNTTATNKNFAVTAGYMF
jgi:opacity protein-like surface antigen